MIPDRLPRITEDDANELRQFIKDYVSLSGGEGVVIGQSGGIDSAVVTKLAVDALGPERVHTIFMPSEVTPNADYESTESMAKLWGTGYEVLNIRDPVDAMEKLLGGELSRLDRGNIAARCRMTILYGRAKSMNRIVLGTTNQSELMMGYFTKFGDGACDALPLVNIYKTNVRQLAKIIGVPDDIIAKPPTAGLWEGQTDEEEMGITYLLLDHILYGFEQERTDREIALAVGLPVEKIQGLRKRVESMKHKRLLAARPGRSI